MIIVTYHAIGEQHSAVSTTAREFRNDLDRLDDSGYSFVSLDTCAEWLRGTSVLPVRSVAITFDDAYANVATSAVPLLAERRIPFTVFAIADRIGRDNRWPGQWPSIRPMPLMNAAQLREIVRNGGQIGAHSWSHPRLPDVDDSSLQREVTDSGDRLAEIIGCAVDHYAYPYGDRGVREIAAVRRRYRTGVSATPDVVRPSDCVHDLPRIDSHDLRIALRLRILDPLVLKPYLTVRRRLRDLRRRIASPGSEP